MNDELVIQISSRCLEFQAIYNLLRTWSIYGSIYVGFMLNWTFRLTPPDYLLCSLDFPCRVHCRISLGCQRHTYIPWKSKWIVTCFRAKVWVVCVDVCWSLDHPTLGFQMVPSSIMITDGSRTVWGYWNHQFHGLRVQMSNWNFRKTATCSVNWTHSLA